MREVFEPEAGNGISCLTSVPSTMQCQQTDYLYNGYGSGSGS